MGEKLRLPAGWVVSNGPDGTRQAVKWVDEPHRHYKEVIAVNDEELAVAVNAVQDEIDGRAAKVKQDALAEADEHKKRARDLRKQHGS